MDARSVPYLFVTVAGSSITPARYAERLRPTGRGWWWLPVILVITGLAIAPIIVPIAFLAWLVNLARFWRVVITVDDVTIRVGKRSAPLSALDLTTLGRAQNTWPWRVFSRRWLGANPIWTRDSVGIRGFHNGKPIWVSVGTDHRDELVDVLVGAVPAARTRSAGRETTTAGPTTAGPTTAGSTTSGWHTDPWGPTRLRWWDGEQWTGWTWPPSDPAGGGGSDRRGSP